ncbi:MAG TPA: GNAT family N-acetyltransferase [Anaeromyxobacter sp.]|nr:GNAT family N-acetyltransferase [Anaeromyxobacter sp.]
MRAAVKALPPGRHPVRALAAWGRLPPLYHRWAMGPGGEWYLLAVEGRSVLGYAALRGRELTAAFVRPGAQGRGVGRALVGEAARRARRVGYRQLRVVAAGGASGFYAALGFCRRGRTRVPLPGGPALEATNMVLPLP